MADQVRTSAATSPGGPIVSTRLTRPVLLSTLVCLLWATCALAVDTTELSDPALQSRYLALTHELRCVQCQNQTIADSPVGIASDLRRQVREMLVAGKSDDDVRDYMVARYGEFILFRPRFSAHTAWLWLAPVVLLVGGALIAVRVLRKRSALVGQDNEPLEEDTPSS